MPHLSSPRIRVAVLSSVHDALDPRIFHKQARTLAAVGFDVHLLARHTRDETRDGVHIHALPPLSSRRQRPFQWLRLAWRTWRLCPRLIHIHDPELLPLLLLLGRLTGAATVYDAHEYYGAEVARRPWIPSPLRRPAARLTDAVETLVARRIDGVVTVNEHMAARFHRRGARAVAVHNYPRESGVGGRRAVTPHPLAALRAGAARRTHSPRPGQASHVVAYVGLLTPDRGLATVYQAAQLLRARLPEATVRVIGRVDWSELPPEIPRDPAAWTAAGVELAGTIPAEDVSAALDEAAVGWIPWLDTANNRYTIPLKLLEYMAAGRPVVASEIGFIAEIVRESGCGVLVPPGDAGAHAQALADLLGNPEERRRMGAAGRAAVRARYTWATEGEKLVRLYQDVLRDT